MVEHNQLLAQSIFPRLNCNQYNNDDAYRDGINRLVDNRMAGGFVVFDGSIETVQTVLAGLRARSGGTLLFAADCEDGVTMRFSGGTQFPSMMALGNSRDVSTTYSVARSIAREMRSIGIHWNFAPVADINTNPENPIINVRAFGESPELVSDHVHAYVQGMQDGGVAACAKHFPGHGDTSVDTHSQLAVLDADRRRLNSVELLPFRNAVRNGVRSIMVGHISVPALDPGGLPASLSEAITRNVLRLELGFDGVIVTDALDMNAITDAYGPAEAALMAYHAGADVLCIPADPVAAYDALVAAFSAKRITVSRLRDSSSRIGAMRKWASAFQDDVQTQSLTWRGHDLIALEAARRSISITGRLRGLAEPLVIVAMVDTPENDKAEEWLRHVADWHRGEAHAVVVTPDAAPERVCEIMEMIEGAASVMMALFVKPRGYAGTVGLSAAQREIADRALARPTVLISFGNPYLLRDAEPSVRIDTFSASSASLAASIEALARATK
ncbi:MAG TPA: glycoside hydrolase family 3 N-terminal domain-containing protein [Candidatus Kapabacteria bacterium]|nr:glycoside hydrolase family 3 N-terminal domain-containing protein [Candidatus Kapabacteria bacterium]